MATVTVIVGSGRRRHTDRAARRFIEELERLGDVTGEVLSLADLDIGMCRGCCNCFIRGEEHCPLKDERDRIFEKLEASDGVVLATPVYSFQVPAMLKVLLDRMGFMFHRPRYFGRVFTSIVVQGIYGGDKVRDYLDFVGGGLGFTTVKGCIVKSLEPESEKQVAENERIITALAARFHARLLDPVRPAPSLLRLMIFRMSRTSIRIMLDDTNIDYRYYRDHGWFTSEYFHPVRMSPFKRLAGRVLDSVAARRAA